MRNTKRTLPLAALFVIAAAVPAALYAQEPHSGSMMRGGMMGGGHMMGGHMMERMSRMMEQCTAMMQGDSRGTRPNDRWRKDVPPEPKE